MMKILLRFTHLKALGIVTNHPQLKRLVELEGFPPGFLLGPNSRAWHEDEVEEWLANRPTTRRVAEGGAVSDAR